MSFERFDAFRCRMFDVFDMNTMYRSGTYKGKKAGERERGKKNGLTMGIQSCAENGKSYDHRMTIIGYE